MLLVSFPDVMEIPVAKFPGAFFTVATLALEPIESLLDAMLNLEGDDVPLCPFLCTVDMLSVEADMPLTPATPLGPISSILKRWVSLIRPDESVFTEIRPKRSP